MPYSRTHQRNRKRNAKPRSDKGHERLHSGPVNCPVCKQPINQCACQDTLKPPRIEKLKMRLPKGDQWRVEPYYWQK